MSNYVNLGPSGEPIVMIVYGAMHLGKSTDQALWDPYAYTVGIPGCLRGARGILGEDWYNYVSGMILPCDDLFQLQAHLGRMVSGELEKRNIRIDDLSILIENTFNYLDRSIDRSDNFYKYRLLKQHLVYTRQLMKQVGVHVYASAHEISPQYDDKRGELVKGGPAAEAKSVSKVIPSISDVIVRIFPEPMEWPFPVRALREEADPRWIFKDRFAKLFGDIPFNGREYFRLFGIPTLYPAGLEWIGDWACKVAELRVAGQSPREILEQYTTFSETQGVNPGHTYWALRDGFARYELENQPTNMLERALLNTGTKADTGVPAVPPPPK